MKLNVAVQSISLALGYDAAEAALADGASLSAVLQMLASREYEVQDVYSDESLARTELLTMPVPR